jgi:hypothetical protein
MKREKNIQGPMSFGLIKKRNYLSKLSRKFLIRFKLSDLFGRQPSAIQNRLKDKYRIDI